MTNSSCRIRPVPQTVPSIGRLYGGSVKTICGRTSPSSSRKLSLLVASAQTIAWPSVRALLHLAEALDPERRDLCQTEDPSGLDAAVAGKNVAGLIDQDGVREAELLDARRDLANLLWRMEPGVAAEGSQGIDRQPLADRLQHR